MFLKAGVLKNFTNFTEKHLCCSLILVNLQACFIATLLKRDSNTGVFLWNLLNSLGTTFFYRTPPVAASTFIRSTHALWIKLIFRDSGADMITSSGCFFLSQDAKHQNTLWQLHAMNSLFDGKYSQWGNRFLPITEAYLEPSRKSTMKIFCKIS